MPDLTQPNQQTSVQSGDQLGSLYKMSTTAGLGTTDYVAINGAAVTAAILGVASWLANFANVLLVIPVVAIVFGIVGLRQISHSSGTQGGRIIAWLGILLALVCGGIVVGKQVRETVVHRADEQQLVQVISQFDAAVKAADVQKAYSLFSPDFQNRISVDKFGTIIKSLSGNNVYGNFESAKWNDVPFQYESSPDGRSRFASGTILMKWSQVRDVNRIESVFRNDGDGWKVYNMPFFNEQKGQ